MKKEAESQKRMGTNALWNAFGNLVYLGLQWLITIFVVRVGGYREAGYLSLAISITGTLQNISHFGIRNYQVSDVEEMYSDREYLMVRLITCTASFLICLGFVWISGYSYKQAVCILWFMLYRIIESISDVFQGMAQKYERLDLAGKSFLLRGILGFLTFFVTYLGFHSLWGSIFGMTISCGLVLMFYDVKKVINLPWKTTLVWDHSKKLLRDCVPLCLSMLIFAAIVTIPRIGLEKLYGTELLGVYSSVFAPAVLVQAGVNYFYMPFISILAKQYEAKEMTAFWTLFLKMTKIMILGFLGVLFLGAVVGKDVLRLFLGEKIQGYEYLLEGILLCTILTAYANFLCTILTILRELKILIREMMVVLVCSLLGTPIWVQSFGIQGTSYALIFPLTLFSFCSLVWMKKSELHREKKLLDNRKEQ